MSCEVMGTGEKTGEEPLKEGLCPMQGGMVFILKGLRQEVHGLIDVAYFSNVFNPL